MGIENVLQGEFEGGIDLADSMQILGIPNFAYPYSLEGFYNPCYVTMHVGTTPEKVQILTTPSHTNAALSHATNPVAFLRGY